ncbi:uncharacterized protein LOC100828643 isoform X2 [Brachypodium distachyon]|uniref:uncharacterized protein LOC100828643 isoform X2 n=1 Tax=Brachypodium distachyon TaxID=15368 RepID=UPI00071D447F|nr:uncharacterized protein LOC100828643 isoform X2 [Brachypodium distachyon]|eukprot:XP_014758278.1 uncharacterized protein LOC100828643 isoform X2 [Brachypodium distachyon]
MPMSLGPPPPRLGAFRRDAALFSAGQSRALSGCAILGRTNLGAGRAYCLFSGGGDRRKQEEARGALESALGQKKTGFEKWGMGVEKRQQRDRRGGPGPAAGGGGGRSGGGGAWLRWFSSGGFWDAAKQTVLTILGIIAAVKVLSDRKLQCLGSSSCQSIADCVAADTARSLFCSSLCLPGHVSTHC